MNAASKKYTFDGTPWPARQESPAKPDIEWEAVRCIEAEQALLGALLFDVAAWESVQDISRAEHFREPFHARLFQAIAESYGGGRAVDMRLLAPRFTDDPAFQELGGLRYLADLIDRAPPPANAPDYARLLATNHGCRDLAAIGRDLAAAAIEPGAEIVDLIAEAERALSVVADGTPLQEQFTDAADVIAGAIQSAMARDGHMDAITGLADVDELTGGFSNGEVTIVGGRPGMAKSLVASQIAKANAARGKGVAVFSQEMGSEPLGLRLACDLAYVRGATRYLGRSDNPTFDAARKGRLTPPQWEALAATVDRARKFPLLFDVRPALTVGQMEAAARRAHRRWKRQGIEPGPVVIDHLGIVRATNDRKGNRHAEVADISRDLAIMAKRLGVPVVVLCQLNRAVETQRGEDKRPQLSDLRQAGEIEEDARCVIFLLRPAYYFRPPDDPSAETPDERIARETKLDRVRDQLLWIVAKNNNGQLGQVDTFIDVACAAIRDRSPT
jgi:replicative DNA helicase